MRKSLRQIYYDAADRAEMFGVTDHADSWSDREKGNPNRCCIGGHVLIAARGHTSGPLYPVLEPLCEDTALNGSVIHSNGQESPQTFHDFSATHTAQEVAAELRRIAAGIDESRVVEVGEVEHA